jgi:hypothetical protein
MTEQRPLHSYRHGASPGFEVTSTSATTNIFPPTDWGLVLSAGDEGRLALERLCRRYWGPLYAFVRRVGYERGAALELVNHFFTALAEQNALSQVRAGSQPFRVWLLTAFETFLADREPGDSQGMIAAHRVPLDVAVADAIDRAGDRSLEPRLEYERVLAVSVLQRALARLERDQADRGQSQRFLAFMPWLAAEPSRDEFSSVERALGLGPTSARMVRHALRQRLAWFIQQEISNLLERRDDTKGLRTEMDALLGALGR